MDQIITNTDIESNTKVFVNKISFLWTIENFSHLPQKYLDSSVFSSDSDNKTKWILRLYPTEHDKENKEFFNLWLILSETDRDSVSSKYNLFTMNKLNTTLNSFGGKHCFKNPKNYNTYQYISKSFQNDLLLPNDLLTICCQISYFDKYETTTTRKTELKSKHKTITDYMELILKSGQLCDVEIVVSGHKFSAHKVILTARSPVFAAMFEHPMRERELNRVDINDIDKENFDKLLRFIYTDKVVSEDIDSNIKLFMAADKYNLEELKSICEGFVSKQLNVETVSEILILADNHSAEELKQKAIEFIKNNSIKVMKTKGWVEVMQNLSLIKLF